MQKNTDFKKTLLASAVASALVGFSGVALAQDEGTIEEVLVTGIKGSLTRSMDIKREASGVVDAISAEDIGKMPDSNLAESLQRIPGVSIDRVNGEGSKVTVRGLAGDYNLVTLNGRQMPASSQATGGISASRSFDFANLASESVAGVEIYKTGRADIATGGMGAVINIQTPHPLKNPGLKATLAVKAVDDTSSDSGDITPEVSGLFSNTFLDDTIGIAIAGSYQKRDFGDSQAYTGGWFTHKDDVGDWAGIPVGPDAPNQTNTPMPGETYSHPVNIGYAFNESTRERSNGQVTLQYRPVDAFTATLDYLYVEQEVETEKHSMGAWFNRSADVRIDWTESSPKAPLYYSEVNPLDEQGRAKDFDVSIGLTDRKNKLESSGLNLLWDVTDSLSLEFDGHTSSSTSGPGSQYGTENGFDFATYTSYNPAVDYSGEFPILTIGAQPGVSQQPDPALAQLSGNNFKKAQQDSDVDQYQLKAVYHFDEGFVKAIRVGADRTEISNISRWNVVDQQNRGDWNGVGSPADIADSFWTIDYMSKHFDASGADDPRFQNAFLDVDFKEALALGAKLYGFDEASAANPCVRDYCTTPGWTAATNNVDQRSVETSTSEYIQGEFETELAGRPVHILAGVRHESTDVEAKSLLSSFSPYIAWKNGNEYAMLANGDEYFEDSGSYSEVLPSIDFDIDLTDDVKLRLSYSDTMARPNYNDIKGGMSYAANPRSGSGDVSSGNPDLDPFISTNYDISVEWYYSDFDYFSVGYFRKDVKDFIGTKQEVIEDSGYLTPYRGARWNEALANGQTESDLTGIFNYIKTNYPDTVTAEGWVSAVEGDPVLQYNYSYPVNNEDASIDGFEVALQHNFGESGFGVIINGTKVDGDIGFDNESVGVSQFAVFGLSDSANFIAFYDKDRIQARIAYNWRDEFLSGIGDTAGSNPVYTEAYGQVDISASYELTDNFTISFEGLNVTDETTRQHGRSWNQLINYTETGARYNVGVRYTF